MKNTFINLDHFETLLFFVFFEFFLLTIMKNTLANWIMISNLKADKIKLEFELNPFARTTVENVLE
jgi:hypothetical protein